MKKIFLFEETSCHAPTAAHLVERLQRWYKATADIRIYDLAAPDDLVPLPPGLFFRLQEEGPSCLPALVVNGTVVAQGGLPSFNQAVELVESQTPVPASTPRPAAVVPAASSCCAPDGDAASGTGCC